MEAAAAGGQIAHHFGEVQREAIEVDHVEIGPFAHLQQSAIIEADGPGGFAAEHVDGFGQLELERSVTLHALGKQIGRIARIADRAVMRAAIAEAETLTIEERWCDFNPWIWNEDHPDGALIRLSPSPILNISAGGGAFLPVFVLRAP